MMDGWMMDGWMNGWMGGWMMNGWMDGWMMDGWMDGFSLGILADGCSIGWTDGRMEGGSRGRDWFMEKLRLKLDGNVCGRMDGWVER